MTGIMNMKRCGTCKFAKLVPQDLAQRVCWGSPPNAMLVPAERPGSMKLQMIRPVVSVSDDACALYRGKDADDVARDEDAIAVTRRM